MKHDHLVVVGGEAQSELGDVGLFQRSAAGRACPALTEVLERARLAEEVPAPREEARAVGLLHSGEGGGGWVGEKHFVLLAKTR